MSLVKGWEVQPDEDVNNGIKYVKQLQLEERATDPTDSDLVDGRIYHQTGVGLRVYEAGSWITLGAAGAGATTFVALTDTPANFTGAGNKIVKVNNGATALEFVTVGGDITIGATGTAAIAAGVIVNADVKSDAAIAYSKLNLTGAVLNADLAGSIAVGKVTLNEGNIMLGDNSNVGSALDASGDAQILVGNGTTITSVAVSGDVSIDNSGATEVSDLTIASEAAGDILYFNGSNWVRLAKGTTNQYLEGGTTPSWSLPALASAGAIQDGAELSDSGSLDATISFTEQTVGGASVVIPDFAGATANTVAFINFAQTFSAKQIFKELEIQDTNQSNSLELKWNEDLAADKTLNFVVGDDRTITMAGNLTISGDLITSGDDSLTFTTGGATDVTLPTTGTLATLAGTETLENKTLTLPKIATGGKIVDANGAEWIEFLEDATPVEHLLITQGDAGVGLTLTATSSEANSGGLLLDAKGSGDVNILNGTELTFVRATQNALIVVADQTGEDHTFNIPNIATGASDTFAFLAEAQTLTNKTINVDNNTVSNINADELDPIGDGAYGIPFLYRVTVTNVDGDTTVVESSAFKFRVIDAWSVNTSGDGGVWSLKTDSGKMTDDVTCAANDTDIDRPTQILDNMCDVAATTGDLYITSDATLDALIYILCIRID